MSELDNFVKIVKKIGISSLQEFIGEDKVATYANIGLSIDSNNLSVALFFEKGILAFKDFNFRERVFFSRKNPNKIQKSICKFTWKPGQEAEKYFDFIGFPYEYISFSEEKKKKHLTNLLEKSKSLHDYQKWMKFKMLSFLNSKNKRVIVHMPTGSGKTRVTMELILDYIRTSEPSNKVIVWMAHSEELCEQACETISYLWDDAGYGKLNLIKLWGGVKIEKFDFISTNFIVSSFQTAFSIIKSQDSKKFRLFADISKRNNLLIIDEAHQSVAETYSQAISLFSNLNTKLIGLTATPGRSNTIETNKLKRFYNNNLISITDHNGKTLNNKAMNYLQQKGILSKVKRVVWKGSSLNLSDKEILAITTELSDLPKNVLSKVGKDQKRNLIILENTLYLIKREKKKCILFAPSKDASNLLAMLLRMKDIRAASITSDMDNVSRSFLIKEFKENKLDILCNYGVLTTGFDVPSINCVIVARPTTSVVLYSQMIGRGMRGKSMGGTEDCLVVDVEDNIKDYPNLREQFVYFNKFYQ